MGLMCYTCRMYAIMYTVLLQEMTVLAFIFDHLLLSNIYQNNGTPPISKVARVFLQCLATIQYPLDAILILVTEFKLAFGRALALPESQLKHVRVRTLTSLLSQILETQNSAIHSRLPVNPSHFSRLLIRRGFISDLARATHSLSLNSPHLVGTINNILKPLEMLTRIVNQVASNQRKTGTGASVPASASATPSGQSGATTSQLARSFATVTSSQSVPTSVIAYPNDSQTQEEDRQPQNNLDSNETPPSNAGAGDTPLVTTSSSAVTTGEQEEYPGDTSFLEATHESLIPLEEEDDEREREQRHEIITLAQELGRQRREELTAAASGDMAIQVHAAHVQVYICHIVFTILLF